MEFQIICQLFLATFLGALIGLEREYKRKQAGLQTYSLVALGSCLFTIISFNLVNLFPGESGISLDPLRVIQAIAIGIGFIGAGVIFRQPAGIFGLTTAAGLWLSSAIGIAVGAGLYFLAAFTTLLAILILAGLGLLEEKLFKKR
ncbi:MAG: MgtC/SapB family protein [Candidatus Nealsonbacteria bacterium]|nr:MAG: MgtC/SapB family protein [Candidatus Nealsonbacteria bacterium]